MKSRMDTVVLLAIGATALLAGCNPGAPNPANSGMGSSGKPESISGAELTKGRAICPIETINAASIRESRSFSVGGKATVVGWSRVVGQNPADATLLHVVFRSIAPDGSADLFWPATRVDRPDKALDDASLLHSGYAATGLFPQNPGKYKVLVWLGDARAQRECDTGEQLDIQ